MFHFARQMPLPRFLIWHIDRDIPLAIAAMMAMSVA
jgi:hypothetical protein